MDYKFCQSCGMPMKTAQDFGTEKDGTLNEDYCVYCYKDGAFTVDCTMEEMIENNLKFLDEFNRDAGTSFNADEARREMSSFFPSLARWKK